MKTVRTPFALVAAATLLALAGCSGADSSTSAGDSAAPSQAAASSPAATATVTEQSKDDACEIIRASFTDVSQASSTISSSDPQAALATFEELATKVQNDFAGITNEEIAPLAQNASDTLRTYSTFLQEVAADPNKASELGPQVTALQDSFTAAGEACEG